MANENVKLQENEVNEDDLFTFVDHNSFESEKITAPRYSYWRSVFRVFFKKKINWILIAVFLLIVFMAIIWPIFHKYGLDTDGNPHLGLDGYRDLSPSEYFEKYGFGIEWILGTNSTGNSNWNALWAGTRTSLMLSIICTVINMAIGIALGAIWGLSKKFDAVMTQVYNIIGNVPFILFISIMMYVLGSGFLSFIIALTVTGWLGIAFFIRTQVIIIRDREYNLASRCLGTGIFTIAFKNILPFLISIIVTILASELPSYIGYEVYLSYIGIGLSANDASIGRIIGDAQKTWMVTPWSFWPAVTISGVISVILYVLGQNIGDASDPRTHMN